MRLALPSLFDSTVIAGRVSPRSISSSIASDNFELAAGLECLKSLPGISIRNLDLHSIVTELYNLESFLVDLAMVSQIEVYLLGS